MNYGSLDGNSHELISKPNSVVFNVLGANPLVIVLSHQETYKILVKILNEYGPSAIFRKNPESEMRLKSSDEERGESKYSGDAFSNSSTTKN